MTRALALCAGYTQRVVKILPDRTPHSLITLPLATLGDSRADGHPAPPRYRRTKSDTC